MRATRFLLILASTLCAFQARAQPFPTVHSATSAYATVQTPAGAAVVKQQVLQFVGGGVTVADDAVNKRTVVTIGAGAGGVASLAGGGGITVSAATGAVTLGSSAGGDLTGALNTATVTGLRGVALAAGPYSGGILYYDSNTSGFAVKPASGDLAFSYAGLLSATVSGLSNHALSFTNLSDGDLLRFNNTSHHWENVAQTALPLAGDVGGTLGASTVEAIQGRQIAATAPLTQQVYAYNAGTLQWEPHYLGDLSDITAFATIGTGLSFVSGVLKIPTSGVTAGTYGSASQSLTATVNAQGIVTTLSAQSIAIAASQVTSGQLAIAQGGTGTSTSPSGVGQFLRSTGAGAWGVASLSSGDIPDLSATYVTLSTPQSISGVKTHTANLILDGATLLGTAAAAESIDLSGSTTGTIQSGPSGITSNGSFTASGAAALNGGASITGPFTIHRTTVADIAYTATTSDVLVAYTSITATRVVDVSGLSAAGTILIIKDESGSASGTVKIQISAGLDGAAGPSDVVTTAHGQKHIYYNGSAWFSW